MRPIHTGGAAPIFAHVALHLMRPHRQFFRPHRRCSRLLKSLAACAHELRRQRRHNSNGQKPRGEGSLKRASWGSPEDIPLLRIHSGSPWPVGSSLVPGTDRAACAASFVRARAAAMCQVVELASAIGSASSCSSSLLADGAQVGESAVRCSPVPARRCHMWPRRGPLEGRSSATSGDLALLGSATYLTLRFFVRLSGSLCRHFGSFFGTSGECSALRVLPRHFGCFLGTSDVCRPVYPFFHTSGVHATRGHGHARR